MVVHMLKHNMPYLLDDFCSHFTIIKCLNLKLNENEIFTLIIY